MDDSLLWAIQSLYPVGVCFASLVLDSNRDAHYLLETELLGTPGVWFGGFRIPLLLFADDAVPLTSSSINPQVMLRWFKVECKAAGMRMSTSICGPQTHSRVEEEVLPQGEEFMYLLVLFTGEGRTGGL